MYRFVRAIPEPWLQQGRPARIDHFRLTIQTETNTEAVDLSKSLHELGFGASDDVYFGVRYIVNPP